MKLFKSLTKPTHRNEHIIKICLLGDTNVGKSTIAHKIKESRQLRKPHEPPNEHESSNECIPREPHEPLNEQRIPPTVGAAFSSIRSRLRDLDFVFHIWDTAGQERFHSMVPFYLRGSDIFLIVFDLTNKRSFENVFNIWLPLIEQHISFSTTDTSPSPQIMIIGNKNDQPEHKSIPYQYITQKITKKFPNQIVYTSISAVKDTKKNIIKNCFEDSFELYYDANKGKLDMISPSIHKKGINIVDLDIQENSGCLTSCTIF